MAGAGRSAHVASQTRDGLRREGFEVSLVETRLAPWQAWLAAPLQDARALVVVGGDGAIRLAAPAAVALGVPVFHLPLGTENLFSREFGTRGGVPQLVSALHGGRTRRIDVGHAGEEPFLLMASLGFDAAIVHDLSARRRGPISHLSYLAPMVRSMRSWTAPRFSVTVDGRTVMEDRRGFLIVANCRQYAARADPVPDADPTDGLLDLVCFPCRGSLGAFAWLLRARLRIPRRAGDSADTVRGRMIEIRCDPAAHLQVDGDAAGAAPISALHLSIEPAALSVLVP